MNNEIVKRIVNKAKLYTKVKNILETITIVLMSLIGVVGMIMRDKLVHYHVTLTVIMVGYIFLNIIHHLIMMDRKNFKYHSQTILDRYDIKDNNEFETSFELFITIGLVTAIVTGIVLLWILLTNTYWSYELKNSFKIVILSVIGILVILLIGERYIERYFLKQIYIVDAEDPETKKQKIMSNLNLFDIFDMF